MKWRRGNGFSLSHKAQRSASIHIADVNEQLAHQPERTKVRSGDRDYTLTASARKLLDRSYREALVSGKNAIEAEHIALALARDARLELKEIAKAFDLLAHRAKRAGE